MKEITVEELFRIESPVIIDIRSPIEFKDDAIPSAINIPLFTDEERREIGIIYKLEGQDEAKWRAMEMVSPKIPQLLSAIREASKLSQKQPVIHCWRGGMRSKAVVTFLEYAGIRAKRLTGGYKAYRQYILKEIPGLIPEMAVVIHGLTGVGKTEILKTLENKGYPILDLEGMAGHRGSIFGGVGLGSGHNQKKFDSLLYNQLRKIQGSPYFLIEAESKRIGKVTQPDDLMLKKMNGINIHVHVPMEQRIQQIAQDYLYPFENESWYPGVIYDALEKVLRRVKDEETKTLLKDYFEKHQYINMIGILLERYYDPQYDYKRQEYTGEFFDIYAENAADAAEKIAVQLEKLSYRPQVI